MHGWGGVLQGERFRDMRLWAPDPNPKPEQPGQVAGISTTSKTLQRPSTQARGEDPKSRSLEGIPLKSPLLV